MEKFIRVEQPHKMLLEDTVNGWKAESPEKYGEFCYWDTRSLDETTGGWYANPLDGVEYPFVKMVWETEREDGSIKKLTCPLLKVVA